MRGAERSDLELRGKIWVGSKIELVQNPTGRVALVAGLCMRVWICQGLWGSNWSRKQLGMTLVGCVDQQLVLASGLVRGGMTLDNGTTLPRCG
jgi:hypothetical protein